MRKKADLYVCKLIFRGEKMVFLTDFEKLKESKTLKSLAITEIDLNSSCASKISSFYV